MIRQTRPPIPRSLWWVGLTLSCGPAMSLLDTTMVNVALPTIAREMAEPLARAQWVVAAYLLALAATLAVTGWLAERVGSSMLYGLASLLFVTASTLAAFAPSMSMLIALRIVQGAAAGLLVPLSQLIISQVAGPLMARVVGAVAAPVYAAPLLGPSIGGLLVEFLSWRAVFLVNIPLGALTILLAIRHLPHVAPSVRRTAFDGIGFVLIGTGVVSFLIGLSGLAQHGFDGWFDGALVSGGLVLGLAFVYRSARHPDRALVDVTLFRRRTFAVSAAIMFFAAAATLSLQFLLPLYLMLGGGYSPASAGLLLAPLGIGAVLATPWIGRLGDAIGLASLVGASASLAVAGLGLFLAMPEAWPDLLRALPLMAIGAGLGCITIPTFSMAYGSIDIDLRIRAMPALNLVQRLGGPIATTLAAGLASLFLLPQAPLGPAFGIFVLPAGALAVIALFAPWIGEKAPGEGVGKD